MAIFFEREGEGIPEVTTPISDRKKETTKIKGDSITKN
jgi:hypothetical protein